ncbi:lipoyl synthase [Sediminicurvatus halobius]|uniref:Lipoyl synthase n=1 Tax=Sediminicurvatus halobius TaxID=2182432 RepID=A0A2U2MYT0_9GAMM|nr:lipoyl synthase [Spiribacter halobius]PWG61957.1 lipoyl synthase [Spiribacter halobius]UEX78364.1 lipoyl synthase [Spiribacter halobius]
MSEIKGIPVVVSSGAKVSKPNGVRAIKNGIKSRPDSAPVPRGDKPDWLRVKIPTGAGFQRVRETVREHRLATVCEESMCPNMGECWGAGTATIMLMGDVCTRACRFCAVDTGNPRGWLDPEEPAHAAETVRLMGLKYVVLTSVDRDDLDDGGAAHYAACIREIQRVNPGTAVEALTPDFKGQFEAVNTVVDTGLEVFAQNVETVRRLTHPVRDPRASYEQTLEVLAHAKRRRPDVLTKTSLMLGLGETEQEVIETLDDLRAIDVDIVTFGQYLRPTVNHLPVDRYVTPAEFERIRQIGLGKGFLEVVSGPLVRSSYRAERVLEKNNVGLGQAAGG